MTKNIFNHKILLAGLAILVAGCNAEPTSSSSNAAMTDKYPPEITLKNSDIKLEKDAEFSVEDNVVSVIDDTDGKLEQKSELTEGEAGYTIDEGNLDTGNEGTYTVSVLAVDSAGNQSKSSYTVEILLAGSEDSPSNIEKDKKTEENNAATTKEEEKTDSSTASNPIKNTGSVTGGSTSVKPTGSNNSGSNGSGGSSVSTSPVSSGTSNNNGSSKNNAGSNSNTGNTTVNNGGNNSSGNQSQTKPVEQPKECSHNWTEITKTRPVVVQEEWVEQVVDQPAYDETVVIKEAHEEPVYEVRGRYVCMTCGITEEQFATMDEFDGHLLRGHEYPSRYYAEDYYVQVGTKWVEAEYGTIHHEATYKNVWHPQVIENQTVVVGYQCSICGATK